MGKEHSLVQKDFVKTQCHTVQVSPLGPEKVLKPQGFRTFSFCPSFDLPAFSNTFLTSLEETSGAFFRRALLPGRVQVPVNVSHPLNID